MSTAPSIPTDPACILCKIAAGQIPCFRIFEDDTVLAFLDINPLATGHCLVIPKAHYSTFSETPPKLLAAISERLPAIAKAILAATGSPAFHLLTNNGPDAMQTIPHLHFHIIPRTPGDTFRIPWHTTPLDKTAGATLASTIQSTFKNNT